MFTLLSIFLIFSHIFISIEIGTGQRQRAQKSAFDLLYAIKNKLERIKARKDQDRTKVGPIVDFIHYIVNIFIWNFEHRFTAELWSYAAKFK